MGSQVEVSLAMNQLMYCNQPKRPLISFSFLGGGISNIALIFDRNGNGSSFFMPGPDSQACTCYPNLARLINGFFFVAPKLGPLGSTGPDPKS